MKKTSVIRLAALIALSGTASYGIPAWGDGKGTELFVTGTAGGQYDDNIFLRTNNAKSDYIATLTPGLQLLFGQGTDLSGSLTYGETFSFFQDNTSQNSSLANVSFLSSFNDQKLKATCNASFVQMAQNSYSARAYGYLIRRDVANGLANAEVKVSEKTSVAVGGVYDRTEYKMKPFVNNEIYRIPAHFYYELTPKSDLDILFQYRNTTQKGSALDSHDYLVGLGARGEFTAKLSGEFHAGAAARHYSNGSDTTLTNIGSSLVYTYSPKTLFQFGLSRDFDAVGSGTPVTSNMVNVSGSSEFTKTVTGIAMFTYRQMDYYQTGQTDKYWEGTLAAKYKFNNYVSLDAGVTHRHNGSTAAGAEFNDNVFTVSVSARY